MDESYQGDEGGGSQPIHRYHAGYSNPSSYPLPSTNSYSHTPQHQIPRGWAQQQPPNFQYDSLQSQSHLHSHSYSPQQQTQVPVQYPSYVPSQAHSHNHSHTPSPYQSGLRSPTQLTTQMTSPPRPASREPSWRASPTSPTSSVMQHQLVPYDYQPSSGSSSYQGIVLQMEDPTKPPKTLQCDGCSARFARKHDLNRHRRIHTQETPYLCLGCEKSYRRSDARKRHWDVEPTCLRRHIEAEGSAS